MADYVALSPNGVQKVPSLLSPDDTQGIFFQQDGSLKVVSKPMDTAANQREALAIGSAGGVLCNGGDVVLNKRITVTTAQINAGFTLLPAVPGLKYRLIECALIAVGGTTAGVTSIDVKATQAAGAVILGLYALAGIARSVMATLNSTGVTILTDGGSFIQNDVNTAITIIKAGADLSGSTGVHVNITYALEP